MKQETNNSSISDSSSNSQLDKFAFQNGFEPGARALCQLLIIFFLLTLILESLTSQIDQQNVRNLSSIPFLNRVSYFLENSAIPRLNKAIVPEFKLVPHKIESSIASWALVSVSANVCSCILLIVSMFFSKKNYIITVALVTAFAMCAIFASILATPLFYASIQCQNGIIIPIDPSLVSTSIYFAYTALNGFLFLNTSKNDIRKKYYAMQLFAIDIPGSIANFIFLLCNIFVGLPITFVIGVSAGLLTYYSLALLFLNLRFWLESSIGEKFMNKLNGKLVTAIGIGAALNASIAVLVHFAKLPIYLDTIGSVFVTLAFGLIPGILAAILGTMFTGIVTTPITIAYVGTAVGVSITVHFLKRFGFGKTKWKTVILGALIVGPISTILSVPITTYIFSGVTFTGSDIVTAFFVKQVGIGLLESVFAGAIFFDSIDKAITCLAAYLIIKNIAGRFLVTEVNDEE